MLLLQRTTLLPPTAGPPSPPPPHCPVISSRSSSSRRSSTRGRLGRASAQAASSVPNVVAAGRYEHGAKAEQGLRGNMEDELHHCWSDAQGYLFLGCYDGHGGTQSAQWLKQHLHSMVEEALAAPGISTAGLATAFQTADQALLQHLQGDDELEQTGSTATVALVQEHQVVVANVGDSQAFIMQRNKQLVSLTTPHRVYGPAKEIAPEVERVKASGGWVYDGRVCNILAVSRAFGDWEFKGPGLAKLLSAGVARGFWKQAFAEQQAFSADPVVCTPATASASISEDDEFLVVSTDGLWDVMPPREAMQYARKDLLRGKRPQEVAEGLVEVALRRYTSDNTSVMVVDFRGAEYWEAAGSKKKGFFSFLSG